MVCETTWWEERDSRGSGWWGAGAKPALPPTAGHPVLSSASSSGDRKRRNLLTVRHLGGRDTAGGRVRWLPWVRLSPRREKKDKTV